MSTPVPSEPRRFSLKDDTCFSGVRANPDDEARSPSGGRASTESREAAATLT